MNTSLPPGFNPLEPGQQFCFACHPDVPCFTECCRELDLALTPYDVLRLKNHLDIHSGRFLEQYVIIEWDESMLFPVCYLTMVDDGKASCIFVSKQGCTVYENRPGSCRAYPIGRGAAQNSDGTISEAFVLITEPHCQGFKEQQIKDAVSYSDDQGLKPYNSFNDALLTLQQHEKIKAGFRPTREQLDQYILALYNLDSFRQELADDRISMNRPLTPFELQALTGDDEQLLLLGIAWLKQEFFGE
ncbi:MAG: zinc/iron-chelating domain-containing protein [Desulfobulbus propionicus]|nr:MAG: zinc/iron-chelating domain-containing protein [Desulfobulbus propionicus]